MEKEIQFKRMYTKFPFKHTQNGSSMVKNRKGELVYQKGLIKNKLMRKIYNS